MKRTGKTPLALAHVNIFKGDVLMPCNEDGTRYTPYPGQKLQAKYTVSHWDDTWLYYEGGDKGEIGWLYYRIVTEGKERPVNSDPTLLKIKKG